MKKRLLLLLCMIACVFSLVACTDNKKESNTKKLEFDEETFQSEIGSIIEDFSSKSKTDAETELENYDEGSYQYNIINSWISNCDDLGELKSIDKYDFDSDDKSITCKVTATYSKRKADMSFIITEDDIAFSLNPRYSMGEKMEKAVLNTLLGMGTVFIVLILIAFLISLFKYINKFEQAAKKKKETATTAAVAVDNTIAQIVEKEENLTDDLELVAVITAAIAASEGNTSTDGLYVRSIRRVNKSKWQRA